MQLNNLVNGDLQMKRVFSEN